jgi:N-acetylglucosamine malate deacetylase 2
MVKSRAMTSSQFNETLLPPKQSDLGLVLHEIAAGVETIWPTVVVVAHPDDETLCMGGRLRLFKFLTILQLTDGSPRDGRDAARLGFCNQLTYSAAREREAERALAVLGIRCRRICYGVPDQESVFRLGDLVCRLERDLRGASLVFTHPYEGGHPDHDTAALAVELACLRIGANGGFPPGRLEFASYHHRAGRTVSGMFWPDKTVDEFTTILDPAAHALKRCALGEYATQAQVIAWYQTGIESYRTAPRYDFGQPPPPGCVQYELFGLQITASRWREAAAIHSPHIRNRT